MGIMNAEWRDRVKHWLRTLKDDFYEPLGELAWEAFPTMEYLTQEEALQGAFAPVKPGFTWGKTYEYCWFKGSLTVPERAAGERIVMNLQPGGESALFVNGKAFGTYRASWVDQPHQFMEDNILTVSGRPGERFEILMETYAGHYFPESPTGGCCTGPVLPGAYTDPKREGERCTLGLCTFGIWNETAYQLFIDADTLNRLLAVLDENSLRAAKIAKALEQFTLTVDFEQGREERIRSYEKAREELQPLLKAENGSTAPCFYAIGNAHLDLAWLWPMAETYRKTERTFAAQLRLLEEYPEYKFLQSQPASYEMCRKNYPELFERIRDAIQKGRWIAEGAMWVEPDTNMAGGEALIRQLVHGKRYYKEVLGTESEVLWLPDTFGYTAALPQILKGCGVKYLVTQKIFWSYNEGDPFPYHYFNWEGIDGTKIVSFLPTSYTYRTDPEEINNIWNNRTQKQDLDAFLLPYGYGDGGGGPSRDFIEYAKRQENLEGGAKVKMAGPGEFFRDMEKQGGPVHTYVGELYFSAHRGTYTSQARTKQYNRKCELALREMEMWGALAEAKGIPYERDKADALWKELLLHQFHDILPGSSIARVYEEAEKALGAVLTDAGKLAEGSAKALTDQSAGEAVTVFNSLGFARKELVSLPECFASGAETADGEPIPVQAAQGTVKALVTIPSCGAVTLVPCETAESLPEGASIAVTEPPHEKGQRPALPHCGGQTGMFGYVRAVTPVLAPEEARRYEAVYCGLCRTLGERYGKTAQLILNYDFVFLAILLARPETGGTFPDCHCPVHPWRKKTCWLGSPALDAAADATVILTWWKLQDALRDGKLAQRMGSRAAALPLRGHYRAAAARWPAFDETVRSCLEELHQLERDRVPSLDRPADTFARILQAAAVETDLAARTRGVQQILYHVGRWIYLADAWDDLAEDQRTGNYNPLLARFGDQAAASKESLRETMRVSLGLANTAFSLLDWGEWEPLLGHILGTGLPAVEEAVFTGQWKQRKRPFHHHQGSAPAAVPTNKEKETYE